MTPQVERRLYQSAELPALLQLDQEKVAWLIRTGQLQLVHIAGEIRIDSRDIDELISTYKRVSARKSPNEQS